MFNRMTCNCKEEKYEGVKKYSGDKKRVLEPMNGVRKVFTFIIRVLFGILVSVIVIVTLPFVVVYVVISAVFGKSVTINLKKVLRRKNGKE